ncbi:MAG: peptidoglycan DD-metalloendopeptidase family protein [Gammaproteobacteria bacterium]|nr:peptidoglycan DD-metalloendopeptidase family protein [Gammaproteobacteria bacterium]
MIKTDYKPESSVKTIFSSSRKRPATPVIIIAVVALSLAIWGLWIELDETTTTEIVSDNLITGEITQSDESTLNLKRQELQLQFDHDKNSSNSENSQDNALKGSSQVNKNTPTSKVNSQQELVDNSISSQYTWNKTKIRSGDSMARVFKRLGFKPGELHAIINLGKNTAILKKIKPGKILEYSTLSNGELNAIRYEIDPLNTLVVIKRDEKWQETIEIKKLEIRLTNSRGTIDSSLFLAGKKAGLTDAMVMSLAGIFGWDIDFILDIREGDNFTVIYEEKYVQGEKFGNGNILAAEFVNQGKAYQAVRYQDTSGNSEYFTPAGMSMRKAFIRNPVDFSYISSKFNPRRYHPILKRVKAHNGVDYRAPKGTPVRAAGDGKVITSTYSKYNGHHVFIQHGQKYITKYLHFTKRKVRRGQRVKQGQVIGYVGSTGLAQAAHLHYEFLVNGVHRNPRTIKLPDAKPINKKEKGRFLTKTRELVKQLEIQKHVFSKSEETAE